MHPLQPQPLVAGSAFFEPVGWGQSNGLRDDELISAKATVLSAASASTLPSPSPPARGLSALPPNPLPPPLPPEPTVYDLARMLLEGHPLVQFSFFAAVCGYCLVLLTWLLGKWGAPLVQKMSPLFIRRLMDAVFVLASLVPRLLAVFVLFVTILALVHPLLLPYALSAWTFGTMVDLVCLLPVFLLFIMAARNLVLLFRGVPPPGWQGVEALYLVLTAGALQAVATGALADVLYLLSWPTVYLSGYFDAWWAVLILPFSIGALVMFVLTKCCLRAGRALARCLPSRSVDIDCHKINEFVACNSVPPLVDLVTNRTTSGWLGRAIFMYPIVIVTSFSFGLSYLLQPVTTATSATQRLLPVCPAPLSDRLSNLGASGLFWLAILLTGNEPGPGRIIADAITGMRIPETSSLQELFELSGMAEPSFASEALLHAAWKLAFEPYSDACLVDGSILAGVAREAEPVGCTGSAGAECVALPAFQVQMIHIDGTICYHCHSGANASVVATPRGCGASYSPVLLGETDLKQATQTGLFNFSGMQLSSGNAGTGLCPGRYRIAFTLTESEHQVFASLDVVDRGTDEPVVTSTNSRALPPFTNPSGTTQVLSTMVTEVNATADTITTTVTTNITTASLGILDESLKLDDSVQAAKARTQEQPAGMVTTANPAAAQPRPAASAPSDAELLPVGTVTSMTTTVEVRKPAQALIMLTPPPAEVRAEEPFTVTLLLQTAEGLAVRGEMVQALLMTPAGSRVRLAPGCSVAITNEGGNATFTLRLTHGDSTHAFLMFASAGTFRFDGVTTWLSAIANAVQGLDSHSKANPLVSRAAANDATESATKTVARETSSQLLANSASKLAATANFDSDGRMSSLLGCSGARPDASCTAAFEQTLARMQRFTRDRGERATLAKKDAAAKKMKFKMATTDHLSQIPIFGHPFVTLSDGGLMPDGTLSAPTLSTKPSRSGFRTLATSSLAAASSALDRAMGEASSLLEDKAVSGGLPSDVLAEPISRIGGVDGLLANFSKIFSNHAEKAFGAQTLERLEACTNLFSVVESAASGASDAVNEAFLSMLQAVQRSMLAAESALDGPAFDLTVARALAMRSALRTELESATTDAAELLAPLAAMWNLDLLQQHSTNLSTDARHNLSAELLTYALTHARSGSAIVGNAHTRVLNLTAMSTNFSVPVPTLSTLISEVHGLPKDANESAVREYVDTLFNGALAVGEQQASQAITIMTQLQEWAISAGAHALQHVPKAYNAITEMMAEPTTRGVDILSAFGKDLAAQPEAVLTALLNSTGLNVTSISKSSEDVLAQVGASNRSDNLVALSNLLRVAGLPIAGRLPDKSTLNSSTVAGIVNGMELNSSGATKCYEAAAAMMSQGQLAIDALPTWPEMLRELQRLGAASVAVVLEQAAVPDGLVDVVAGQLTVFWPDFGTAWNAHLTQVSQDLGRIGEAVEDSVNDSGLGSASDEVSSPSHAAYLAKRRLLRSVRGRALLATLEAAQGAPGHQLAMKQWQTTLDRQMRYAKAATSGGKHDRQPTGTTLLQTTSAEVPVLSSVSTDWTWVGHSALVGLLGLPGTSAPPTSALRFNGTGDTAMGVVSTVMLTAPLVGYGIARDEVGSFTARTVPVETLQLNGASINQTLAEHFVVDEEGRSAPALKSCAAFGYPTFTSLDQQPEVGMLFQPSGMMQFNWLLNAGERPDGSARNYCPQLDGALHGRTVVSEDHVPERPYGRFGLSALIFDPNGDVAAAKSAPSGDSDRARLARQQIERSCPRDPVSLMRTEIAPLCRESYIATGQKAPFTDSTLVGHADSAPQLLVHDALGNPVVGKSCKIEVANQGGFFQNLFDLTPLRLVYECGPSDANGVIAIRDLRIVGGSSRPIEFRITVDNIEAKPKPGSPWRFDSQMFYVSSDHNKDDHLGVIFFGGSGSIHLFVFLSLLVMSHNALSLRYNASSRAPLTVRLLGLVSLLALCYTTSAFFSRHFIHGGSGTDSEVGRISLISMRDMVSTRTAALSLGSWTLAVLSLLLSVWITFHISRIWTMEQLEGLAAACRRAIRKCGVSHLKIARAKASVRARCLPFYNAYVKFATMVHDRLCGESRSMSACICKLPGAARVSRMYKALSTVTDDIDGQIEPPPYVYILGFRAADPFEPRAERRQRCARNYVRKHFRGRRWVREKLEQHTERIKWRSSNIFTRCLSRILGLDLRVHPHLPFEGPDSLFYPERLYYAAILSLWFQLLISLALTSATRAVRGQSYALGQRIAELDAMAAAHMQPQALAALGAHEVMPLSAIFLTVCVNCYSLLGIDGGVQSLIDFLNGDVLAYTTPFSTVAGIIAAMVHIAIQAAFFRRYRRRIFDMRMGRYFFVRDQYDETACSSFIGYQVAFMVFATGVLLTIFFTVVCAVGGAVLGIVLMLQQSPAQEADVTESWPPPLPPPPPFSPPPTLPDAFRTYETTPPSSDAHADAYTTYAELLVVRLSIVGVPAFVWWLVVTFLFQWILNTCVWFLPASRHRNGDIANRWLRFRFWYSIYEYMLILPNVAIGLVFIQVRSFVAFVFSVYYAFSIDICLVPSGTGIEACDPGHSTYVAVARNDHRYNNPIVMVFLGLVQDELHERRLESGRIKVRTQLRKNIAERRTKLQSVVRDAKVEKDIVATDVEARGEALLGVDGITSSEDLILAAQRRRRSIRRWQLAYTLTLNPTLINMRASKLVTYDLDRM